jgi:hypothetical protein
LPYEACHKEWKVRKYEMAANDKYNCSWKEGRNSIPTGRICSVIKQKLKEEWCAVMVPKLCSAEVKGSADYFWGLCS